MPTGSTRRARSDSVAAAVRSAQEASQPAIAWPEEITPLARAEDHRRALSIFARILAARARSDWRLADLPLAAQLANATVLADKLMAEIEQVGFTVASPKNPEQRLRNPALDGLSMMSSRQLSLQRMLGLSGVPGGDKRTTAHNMPDQTRPAPMPPAKQGEQPDWVAMVTEKRQ
jgi:hypothetical protein